MLVLFGSLQTPHRFVQFHDIALQIHISGSYIALEIRIKPYSAEQNSKKNGYQTADCDPPIELNSRGLLSYLILGSPYSFMKGMDSASNSFGPGQIGPKIIVYGFVENFAWQAADPSNWGDVSAHCSIFLGRYFVNFACREKCLAQRGRFLKVYGAQKIKALDRFFLIGEIVNGTSKVSSKSRINL